MIAKTPSPPYYAVIFSSILNAADDHYSETGDMLAELAKSQDGFLGIESARSDVGITVSYWKDLESIKQWKAQTDHQIAQKKGITTWYKEFKVRIAKVERDYGFGESE